MQAGHAQIGAFLALLALADHSNLVPAEPILLSALAFMTTSLTSAAKRTEASSQALHDQTATGAASARDPAVQVAAVVNTLVQIASDALTDCRDGE